jgi:hypothetical protein
VPPLAPDITPPADERTRQRVLVLTVTVPELELRPRDVRLQVLRDGRVVADQRGRPGEVVVDGLELKEGRNTFTAQLVGPLGAGPQAVPVVIVRDTQAPPIELVEPRDGQTVHASKVSVKVRSEPGARLTLRNETNGWDWEETVGPNGQSSEGVPLAAGINRIIVSLVDELGNRSREVMTRVKRGDAAVALTLSDKKMSVSALPRYLTVTLETRDENGRPVVGARVRFTLSPSGQSTQTFDAVTGPSGRARWRVQIPKEGAAAGLGPVVAHVTLPDGREVTRRRDLRLE